MRCLFRFGAGFTAVLALAACGGPAPVAPAPAPPHPAPAAAPAAPARVTPAAARQVGADELGRVPVLMYHRIVPQPRSVYDRTPADFTAELERLAAEGYVPVTTAELVSRRLDLPAGAHPVVLTFDDGDPTVFRLTPQGQPEPGTAIRILLDVAAAHPGFRPVASLYVNEHPFGGDPDGRALRWLAGHGFEIGNHTRRHTNLRTATESAATAAIAEEDALIRQAVPGYQPKTLALPYGSRPRRAGLALQGPGYAYGGALLVGAGPAPSPCSAGFDPASIPRIRSQSAGTEAEYGSSHWLDELASSRRYTSDGDPSTVSYPRSAGPVAPECASVALAY
ncbi:polysaccharide deacetylase family protein [Amycolatopsis sp. lyj-346]|uniref:polysaccharide deacetylase family protein n=1 Tax=Amycolatopsis sp. lyj-346 TaxID=2789289 RepID=UPI00397963F3